MIIYLFLDKLRKPFTNRCIELAMEKAVKKVGINRKATPHTLRHSYSFNE